MKTKIFLKQCAHSFAQKQLRYFLMQYGTFFVIGLETKSSIANWNDIDKNMIYDNKLTKALESNTDLHSIVI